MTADAVKVRKNSRKEFSMKMFNKADCEYKGGYIVCGDKVVAVDNEVVDLFNKLEEDIQRANHNRGIFGGMPAVEPAPFHRQTERGNVYPHIEAETPELDKAADVAIKIMDELDAVADAEKCNEYFTGIHPLILFVNDDFIVAGEQATQHRFDLPTIGNPLELDKDKLSDLVMGMFE